VPTKGEPVVRKVAVWWLPWLAAAAVLLKKARARKGEEAVVCKAVAWWPPQVAAAAVLLERGGAAKVNQLLTQLSPGGCPWLAAPIVLLEA